MKAGKIVRFKGPDSSKIFEVEFSPKLAAAIKGINPSEHQKILESWADVLRRLPMRHQAKQEVAIAEELLQILKDNFQGNEKSSRHGTIVSTLMPFLNRNARKQVLWLLQFEELRTLNSKGVSPVLLNAVTQAVHENDAHFFIQLGRRLSERPKPLEKETNLNPLKTLMLGHWVRRNVSMLQFCYFTDQALADFLKEVAPNAGATFDGVRSTRKRLRLLRTKPLLVKKVSFKNNSILLG